MKILNSALLVISSALVTNTLPTIATGQPEIINPRPLPNTEESIAAQSLLRTLRDLENTADRQGEFDVENAANRMRRTLMLLLVQIGDNASISTRLDTMDRLETNFYVVRRQVRESSDSRIDDLYQDVRRKFYVLKDSLGTNPGEDVSLVARYDTYFKVSTAQAITLRSGEKCLIQAGEGISIHRLDTLDDDHIEVTLTDSIPGCRFGREGQRGYIWGPHFRR